MPSDTLARKLLLPELKLTKVSWGTRSRSLNLHADKVSSHEVCPNCATASSCIYDRRWVRIKDSPLQGQWVSLHIRKRRFSCKPCGKPFTEPVPGIMKGFRSTQRYRRSLLWACENFSDLSAVKRAYGCSSGVVYKTLYEQLERKRRQHTLQWPKTIGIDEHLFKRHPHGYPAFVTSIVDYKGKRVMELVEGRQAAQLDAALCHIPERDRVQNVICDLADPYKKFAREFFPNATVVADKFHVLRLLNPAINRRRKEITGDKRKLRVRTMLLRSAKKMNHRERSILNRWLERHPILREVYQYKEALHSLYRMRGQARAQKAYTKLTDAMAKSNLPEIKTLRRTMMRWRNEILAYFENRLTNARTEGFNNKMKLVKRRGYGYKSFRNYRLRCLNACS